MQACGSAIWTGLLGTLCTLIPVQFRMLSPVVEIAVEANNKLSFQLPGEEISEGIGLPVPDVDLEMLYQSGHRKIPIAI